jgi:hypothetical protein
VVADPDLSVGAAVSVDFAVDHGLFPVEVFKELRRSRWALVR